MRIKRHLPNLISQLNQHVCFFCVQLTFNAFFCWFVTRYRIYVSITNDRDLHIFSNYWVTYLMTDEIDDTDQVLKRKSNDHVCRAFVIYISRNVCCLDVLFAVRSQRRMGKSVRPTLDKSARCFALCAQLFRNLLYSKASNSESERVRMLAFLFIFEAKDIYTYKI